ncbi:MAG: uncharacterized protein KVP18_001051 [Porospora cf. gigantea A]|uniref:uncharacterized protein n=1 Tax=Porospora cf. gigantea A TaxID=2853593 RepID=UPI003559DA65|nr:MAG: hypothetical protein KVP18_001051 [Porospora cf. gigantea A]
MMQLAFGLTGALLLWSFEKYLSEGSKLTRHPVTDRYAVELGRDEPSQFQRIGLPADLEQGLMTHRSSSGIQLVH